MPKSVEIESLEQFDAWFARPKPRPLSGVTIQAVDLSERGAELASVPVVGTMFMGCRLTQTSTANLRNGGALIFPVLPNIPFDPYRAALYDAAGLYEHLDQGYEHTPDATIYAWSRQHHATSVGSTLAMSLHDHAMTDALDELPLTSTPERCIGIMGGHAAQRGSDSYRAAAHLGAHLTTAGFTVMTGGGPGAMEAANLGAALADASDEHLRDVHQAVDLLAEVPSFRPTRQGGQGITAWARQAFLVRERYAPHGVSLGIPTWFYGHEPPNAFATHIAKYFSNALREDELLHRCRGGIIYLGGAAGTVQEIFQAATGNYYSPETVTPTPMVLVGVEHWTTTLPAWPLLSALGRDKPMGAQVHLVDTVAEALEVLLAGDGGLGSS